MQSRILIVSTTALGLWLALARPAVTAEPANESLATAEAMMRKAHLARSGWDDSFPGFQAVLHVAIDGDNATGRVTIDGDGGVELQLPAGSAADWAREQLESITMHRRAETRDRYDVSFADEITTHPLGRLIKFHGGTTHSVYRIKGDVITEVHRQMQDKRFTISVTGVDRNEQGQTLPRHFNVSYWDVASGQLDANHDFSDDWVRLGKYDLPAGRLLVRTAKNGRQVYAMRLEEHRLLEKSGVRSTKSETNPKSE
jgi:hypothetical protein